MRGREPGRAQTGHGAEAEAHGNAYTSAIEDDLLSAAKAGAAEVGGTPDNGALARARQLIHSGLVGSLRDRLQRAVAAGAGDNADITRAVRNVYREWKTQHIDDALDDVFRFAYAGGVSAALEPGTAVVWTIDPSQVACADCEDNSLAGSVSAGSEFPTGHLAAPAHPGCHCLVLPVG